MITDISVKKMDHTDPRYPGPIEGRPFHDIYLLTAVMADGSSKESPFFVSEAMTPDHASTMLKLFAKAIADLQTSQEA